MDDITPTLLSPTMEPTIADVDEGFTIKASNCNTPTNVNSKNQIQYIQPSP